MAQQLAHLLHREVLADAVRGAERERDPRIRVVHEWLRVFLQALGDEPAFGPEAVGVGKVAWIAVDGPEVDARLGTLGDVTATRCVRFILVVWSTPTDLSPIIRPPLPFSGARWLPLGTAGKRRIVSWLFACISIHIPYKK